MSILKFKDAGKNSVDPLLRDDPFELFTLENYEPPRPQASKRPSRPNYQNYASQANQVADYRNEALRAVGHSNSGWRKWTGLVACCAIAACAALITYQFVRVDTTEAVKPYAYFDVRVIDSNGHPVAGALVRNGGRKIGTTDSFGEWRRYMKVTLGSTVSLGFNKKTASENLASIKNFAVPAVLPKEGDLGIKGTVQILREAEFLSVNNIREVRGQRAAPDSADSSGLLPDEVVAENSTASPVRKPEGVTGASTQTITTLKEAEVEPGPANYAAGNALDSISIVTDPMSVDGKKAAEVTEAMRQRAKELGINVTADARWRVSIQGLQSRQTEAAASGLFAVRSEIYGIPNSKSAFLRNYENDARTSARGALWILSMHVQKDFNVGGRDGAWTVSDSGQAKGLFQVIPGKPLVSDSGRLFMVSNEAIMVGPNKSYMLNPPDIRPCDSNGTVCSIFSQSIASVPPIATWKRLQLKAGGLQKPATEIFVSGYAATSAGRGVWEFWGAPGTAANVTVLIDGKLVHRAKIGLRSETPASLTLPVMGVSRR